VKTPRQVTLARLHELRIRPDTRLGQHFLIDDNLVRVALRLADLRPGDVALEVGAGLGVLTAALADAVAHVHAVEIDTRLEPAITRSLAGRGNVTMHFADALRVEPARWRPAPTVLVANLPYAIATPVIVESLGGIPSIERWAVMVQREVAERLLAAPGSASYGAASVLVALACVKTGHHPVGTDVFVPKPRVASALVGLRRRDEFGLLRAEWPDITRFTHAAFAHRRKTLANAVALRGAASRERAEAALVAIGLTARVRAQDVAPDAFVALARLLR
jgi:16S rRNA (adenine1518-N6/adenine1519-N6)-dimethyltransferase